MKIKTYLVPTLSEAVERIKSDLGPEAVILSTRKVQGSGKFWNRDAQLEVTAALDSGERVSPELQTYTPSNQPNAYRWMSQVADQSTSKQIEPLKGELQKIREALEILTNRPEPSYQQNREPVAAQASSITDGQAQDSAVYTVCHELLEQRVLPQIVEELSQHLVDLEGEASEDVVREKAALWLLHHLPEIELFEPGLRKASGKCPQILAVFGPTGSGKTTTLVKLASHLILAKGKKVAFITLDNFRIGGKEQLQRHAQILKAPCTAVSNHIQLENALRGFASMDAVLIDTSGCSPNDAGALEELKALTSIKQPIWRTLVIPSTLQEPDLGDTIRSFQATQYEHLMITKLDETRSFGSLINAPLLAGVPLSYFTMGQQIPEDFEEASKERILDCLLHLGTPEATQQSQETASQEVEGTYNLEGRNIQ